MYNRAYLVELVTYKKYFVDRKYIACDGSSYKKPQPFIGFYVNDDTISRLPFNIIFRQVHNGHLVWVHINNDFYEICLPYLDQIRNYKRKMNTLQNLCKQSLSTQDIYFFNKYS
jgi:hypothetical protein